MQSYSPSSRCGTGVSSFEGTLGCHHSKGLSVENKLLDLRIMEALGKLEEEFNITLPTEKKDKFSFGWRTLVKDLLTADLIMKGFERTGQCPVDFYKIIGQCYTSLDQEMHIHMSERLAHDVSLFRAQGGTVRRVRDTDTG